MRDDMDWIGLIDDTFQWLAVITRFYEGTEVVGRMKYCHFLKKNYAAWICLLPE